MKNSLVLLAVVLSVAAFAGMMRIKTDVQTMDRERLRLVNERAELRETKRVLEAEWALLASPERLSRLAAGKDYVPASALDVVPLVTGTLPMGGASSATLTGMLGGVSASSVVSAAEALSKGAGKAAPMTGSAIGDFEAMQQAEATDAMVSDTTPGGEVDAGGITGAVSATMMPVSDAAVQGMEDAGHE